MKSLPPFAPFSGSASASFSGFVTDGGLIYEHAYI